MITDEACPVPDQFLGRLYLTLPVIPANWRPAAKPTEKPESARELVVALNATDEAELLESITIHWDMP